MHSCTHSCTDGRAPVPPPLPLPHMHIVRSSCSSALRCRRGSASSTNRLMPSTTQVSEFAQRQLVEGVIDFAAGQPGPALLPLEQISAAAADRLTGPKADPFILQYGPEQGYTSFRRCLADFLSKETGHPVDAEELLITAGVSHGLDLACRQLGCPGDQILVEQPTYFLAGSILRQAGLQPVSLVVSSGLLETCTQLSLYAAGARLWVDSSKCRVLQVPVPTGPDGLDVDALEQLLGQPGGPRPKLCYTIPIHNNPTGATIPLEKRIRLLQLAHQHDFVLLCDEVYQLLTFDGSPPPPPPMRAVECSLLEQGLLPCSSASSNALTPGRQQQAAAATPAEANSTASSSSSGVSTQCESRVVSLGSFSKIMAPGLRLGWVDAAAPFLQMLRRDGVLGSGGSIAPLASGIAHSCLELGLLQQHMHGTVRPALQRNCAALCEALRQHLPAGCNFRQPDGGYFVWLHLPDEVCSQELVNNAAERFAVKFTPGLVCDGQAHNIRLSFAFYQEHELQEGARRLGAAISSFLQERS